MNVIFLANKYLKNAKLKLVLEVIDIDSISMGGKGVEKGSNYFRFMI